MISTASSANENPPVGESFRVKGESRKPPVGWHTQFLRRAPALGNRRARFPRCPKAQTSGRHPIPTKIRGSCCDPEYALNYTGQSAGLYVQPRRPSAPTSGQRRSAAGTIRSSGGLPGCVANLACPSDRRPVPMCEPRPAPFTSKWRHFEPPSILCAAVGRRHLRHSFSYRAIEGAFGAADSLWPTAFPVCHAAFRVIPLRA